MDPHRRQKDARTRLSLRIRVFRCLELGCRQDPKAAAANANDVALDILGREKKPFGRGFQRDTGSLGPVAVALLAALRARSAYHCLLNNQSETARIG